MNNISFKVACVTALISVFLSYLYVISLIFYKETEFAMAKNGLLFISSAAKAHSACVTSSKHVNKLLYIKIKETSQSILPVMSKQIVELYSKASYQCGNLDVRLILKPLEASSVIKTNYPLDLILYDSELTKELDSLRKMVASSKSDLALKSVDVSSVDSGSNEPVKTYSHVAVGGTFDRLHNGHKILLSQAALRATKHLTVGVTDVNMIQSKKLWELIEPVEMRIKAVLDFLTDIKPDLEYKVVPIQDMYGPTKDDPKFEMLIVSEETVRGGAMINEKRKENGLKPLDTYVISLAQDSSPTRVQDEESKVSSSNHRMRMLGTVLRPPVPNPNIPAWPYVIGLAGGIASGKSNIAEKLKAKGAAIVNCDLIAHELYKPGLPLNATLADTFGRDVVTDSGEIDRKKLGSIVFSDQTQLEKLNSIIWPAIIAEAENRIRALGQSGYRVVVIEAAVMVRAKWYSRCHQLWAVIIPPAEAVKRMMVRNNLTEEEAKQRIASQPSNVEQIEHANVVFSPFWSYEYTQSQIDRAWDALQEYLRERE